MPKYTPVKLVQLQDVKIAALTDGQVLAWNLGDLRWENSTISGGGGGDMFLAGVQEVTGAKTFDDGKLVLKGSTSGAYTLHTPAIAGFHAIKFQTATGTTETIPLLEEANTFTLAGNTFNLGLTIITTNGNGLTVSGDGENYLASTLGNVMAGSTVFGDASGAATVQFTNTGAVQIVGPSAFTVDAATPVTISGTLTATLTGNSSSATKLATARAINGVNFDGTAGITVTAAASTLSGSTLNSGVTASSLTSVGTLTGGATGAGFTVALGTSMITGILGSANGGTGNGFAKLSGPASSEKTFTLPNASATILTDNAVVTVAEGGTGLASGTSGGVLAYIGSGTLASSGLLTANAIVLGGGSGVAPKTAAGITTNGTAMLSLGVSGTSQGQLVLYSIGTGSITLAAPSGAIGSVSLMVPASNGDTLVGRQTTDNLTNKTVIAPVMSGGLTAAGSATNDFSGSTGPFKTSTGANTIGGPLTITGKTTSYNAVATAGWGQPAIYASARQVAQSAAVASLATYTVGAADGSFIVSANVLVTVSTLHSFTVTCAYTDEGNTSRVVTMTFSQLAGTLVTAIANAGGTVPYEGVPLHIRCKAATAITIATTGTFTTVTYNAEGVIQQIA